jgi:four helix bundle protein
MKESLIQQKSFAFSLVIIKLYQELLTHKEYVISKQLLRSGTSIGANVEEGTPRKVKEIFFLNFQ